MDAQRPARPAGHIRRATGRRDVQEKTINENRAGLLNLLRTNQHPTRYPEALCSYTTLAITVTGLILKCQPRCMRLFCRFVQCYAKPIT